MSSATRIIKGDELQVGQWIQFFTNQNLDEMSKNQQGIYDPRQRYLVFSRQEGSHCFLIDINKQIHNYKTATNILHRTLLTDDVEIRVIQRADVESMHGIVKVKAVYHAAARFMQAQSKKEKEDTKEQNPEIQSGEIVVATVLSAACIIC